MIKKDGKPNKEILDEEVKETPDYVGHRQRLKASYPFVVLHL